MKGRDKLTEQPTKRTIGTRDGVTLGFTEIGEGVPCVLLHGLSASAKLNWLEPGVADHLARSRLRVIALDFRGHGDSESPPEPSAYSLASLIDDTEDLLKGLDLGPCHLVGYSLGALVAAHFAAEGRLPLLSLVLAGIGTDTVTFEKQDPAIVDAAVGALLEPNPGSITNPAMQAYRMQVEAWGADPASVAAMVRDLQVPHEVDLGAIKVPTLVVNGEGDAPPAEIADEIPGSTTATVEGDHLTAPSDPAFAEIVAGFLGSSGN